MPNENGPGALAGAAEAEHFAAGQQRDPTNMCRDGAPPDSDGRAS